MYLSFNTVHINEYLSQRLLRPSCRRTRSVLRDKTDIAAPVSNTLLRLLLNVLCEVKQGNTDSGMFKAHYPKKN